MIEALSVVTSNRLADRSKYNEEKLHSFERLTGILKTRHSLLSPMSLARMAIAELKFHPTDISTVIYVTQTPEQYSPAHAVVLASDYGLPKDVAAFDMNQSCTGFVYGLDLARKFSYATGGATLLICVDKLRLTTGDVDDLIFSDAACACVVRSHDEPPHMVAITNGEGAGHLFSVKGNLVMDGSAVFDFMAKTVPTIIRSFAGACDYAALHQANELLMDIIDRRSGFTGKSLRSIREYGNMSMVSIPMALAANENKILGKTILLAGFGAGWSIATTTIRWPQKPVTSIREIDA